MAKKEQKAGQIVQARTPVDIIMATHMMNKLFPDTYASMYHAVNSFDPFETLAGGIDLAGQKTGLFEGPRAQEALNRTRMFLSEQLDPLVSPWVRQHYSKMGAAAEAIRVAQVRGQDPSEAQGLFESEEEALARRVRESVRRSRGEAPMPASEPAATTGRRSWWDALRGLAGFERQIEAERKSGVE